MTETTHLSNFSQEFIHLLQSVAQADDVRGIVKLQLQCRWTETELQYFYALVFLTLASDDQPRWNILKGELDRFMMDIAGAKVLKEVVDFSCQVSPDLPISIGNFKSQSSPSAADILKIWRIYTESMPRLDFLRDSTVLDILLNDAFGPNASQNHINQRLEILAIASARDGAGGEKDTLKELKSLHSLLGKVNSMGQIQYHFTGFISAIKLPITSCALITWISYRLQDPTFYEWTAYFVIGEEPFAFYLLDEIAIQQPRLRPRLIELWIQILLREFSITEVKPEAVQKCRERILEHFVLLAKLDSACIILNRFQDNMNSIDDSLVLFFIKSVISFHVKIVVGNYRCTISSRICNQNFKSFI